MRIGIDIRWLHQALSHKPDEESPGGIGTYSLNFARHLLEMDKQNEYILFGSRSFPKESLAKYFKENGGTKIVFLPTGLNVPFAKATLGAVVNSIWQHLAVAPIIRAQNLDIMHFQEQGAVIVTDSSYETVLTIPDLIYSVYPEQYFSNFLSRWLWQRHVNSFRRVDRIIAISANTKNDIIKYAGIQPDKIDVIHCGLSRMFRESIDSDQLTNVLKSYSIDKPYFLYVGGIQFNKNVPAIVEAFNRLVDLGKDVQLVLVGEHEFEPQKRIELMKQITNYGLKTKIILTGRASQKELRMLYSGAIALVHPAFYEGFGLTPLEAMACGCPVIASQTSSLPEVVGEAGLKVNPTDSADIARAMRILIENPTERKRLKTLGIERSSNFGWKQNAAKTLAIYSDLR